MSKKDEMKLDIVEWEGRIHCVYLDNYRIAGGKPWGGGKIIKSFKISRKELEVFLGRGLTEQV
jgi:hypothetical protein